MKTADDLARATGPIKRIHVDKHVIAANAKHGRNDPSITIQTSRGSIKVRHVWIHGLSQMRSDKPLSCGARVYVETTNSLAYS